MAKGYEEEKTACCVYRESTVWWKLMTRLTCIAHLGAVRLNFQGVPFAALRRSMRVAFATEFGWYHGVFRPLFLQGTYFFIRRICYAGF